jgi:hybrid cluster-associated redox disulfide protein
MKITQDTSIEDILKQYPHLVRVFVAHGLPCLVCGNPYWGTVSELAEQHSIDIAVLVKELNEKKQRIDEKL